MVGRRKKARVRDGDADAGSSDVVCDSVGGGGGSGVVTGGRREVGELSREIAAELAEDGVVVEAGSLHVVSESGVCGLCFIMTAGGRVFGKRADGRYIGVCLDRAGCAKRAKRFDIAREGLLEKKVVLRGRKR